MLVHAIGTVRSPVVEPTDLGWGQVTAEIHLAPRYADGLQGIEQFSHLVVVTWLHGAHYEADSHLVRRPRGRQDMPEVGIFAQRAKDRPNPIGITAVPLVSVARGVIVVTGLDAIDGTPVIEIKPYYPVYDRVEHARTPEWVDRLMADYF